MSKKTEIPIREEKVKRSARVKKKQDDKIIRKKAIKEKKQSYEKIGVFD